MRKFDADALAKPDTFRERFTDKGRIRRQYGGGWSFQVSAKADGSARIWVVGPLGWWHDFQMVPPGTSFDEALAKTTLPYYFGWLGELEGVA